VKTRVISAIVMVLLFVPLLILGELPFTILVAFMGLLGLKEMLDLEKDIPQVFRYIGMALGLLIILYNQKVLMLDYRVVGGLFLLSAVSFREKQ